jgi:hypothetical protein
MVAVVDGSSGGDGDGSYAVRLSAVERRESRSRFFKPVRQVIESVNDIFKGQLDLERHDGHTPAGVTVQILQRVLAQPPPSGTTTILDVGG